MEVASFLLWKQLTWIFKHIAWIFWKPCIWFALLLILYKPFFDGKYFHKIWYFLNFFKSKEKSCIYLLKFFGSFRQRVTFDFCESISAGYTVHTSSFSEDTSGFFQAILPLKGSICLPGLTTCRNHLENVK